MKSHEVTKEGLYIGKLKGAEQFCEFKKSFSGKMVVKLQDLSEFNASEANTIEFRAATIFDIIKLKEAAK